MSCHVVTVSVTTGATVEMPVIKQPKNSCATCAYLFDDRASRISAPYALHFTFNNNKVRFNYVVLIEKTRFHR